MYHRLFWNPSRGRQPLYYFLYESCFPRIVQMQMLLVYPRRGFPVWGPWRSLFKNQCQRPLLDQLIQNFWGEAQPRYFVKVPQMILLCSQGWDPQLLNNLNPQELNISTCDQHRSPEASVAGNESPRVRMAEMPDDFLELDEPLEGDKSFDSQCVVYGHWQLEKFQKHWSFTKK